MSTDPKIIEITSYLESEFPGFAILRSKGANGEAVFRLSSGKDIHVVNVQQAFLESTSAADIKRRLEEFRLAGTLRDIGEFPIVVSINGCIFA